MQTSSSVPRIAAVVVTYNRCALLEECLDCLLLQDRQLDEILVIDNASTDGTRDMLKQKYDGKVTHVQLKENLGASAGFFEGTRLAYEKGHDWIWVMDDDVEPAADALNALVKSSAFEDPSVGALASLILTAARKPHLGMYFRFNSILTPRPAVSAGDLQSPLLPIEGGSFVGLLVRREAITSVGLPLKDLFIYWDDTEFVYRVSKRLKVLLVPTSKVVHRNALAAQSRRRFLGFLEVGPGVPFEQAWRTYYLVRNGIFFRVTGASRWLTPLILISVLARPTAAVLLLRDHKVARCKLLWRAAVDGVLCRLGKRVGPWLGA